MTNSELCRWTRLTDRPRLPIKAKLQRSLVSFIVRRQKPLHDGLDAEAGAIIRLASRQAKTTIKEQRLRSDALGTVLAPRSRAMVVCEGELALSDRTIKVHLYRDQTGRLGPGLIYFHGGGFVSGSLKSHDAIARALSERTGAGVLAVEYRLAPENPFPSAVEDAVETVRAVFRDPDHFGFERDQIGVAGDSAGGALAATAAAAMKDEGRHLALQLLIYPVLDLRMVTQSYTTYGVGYGLTAEMMRGYSSHYLEAPDQVLDPRCSPGLRKNLAGLAPAIIVAASHDPLRDEAVAYHERLLAAGVQSSLAVADGLPHGFLLTAGVVRSAAAALDRLSHMTSEVLFERREAVS
jgi:acetyl esterase